MKIILKIYHSLFKKHQWKLVKSNIGFYGSGDVLPETGKYYRCKCGATRIKVCRLCTHFGGKKGEVRIDKINLWGYMV